MLIRVSRSFLYRRHRRFSYLWLLLAAAGAPATAAPDWSAGVLERYVYPVTLDTGVRLNAVDYAGLRTEPAFGEAAVQYAANNPAHTGPGCYTEPGDVRASLSRGADSGTSLCG